MQYIVLIVRTYSSNCTYLVSSLELLVITSKSEQKHTLLILKFFKKLSTKPISSGFFLEHRTYSKSRRLELQYDTKNEKVAFSKKIDFSKGEALIGHFVAFGKLY